MIGKFSFYKQLCTKKRHILST